MVVLVLPFSLVWFINHTILQIPAYWFVDEKEDMLIRDITQIETIYLIGCIKK